MHLTVHKPVFWTLVKYYCNTKSVSKLTCSIGPEYPTATFHFQSKLLTACQSCNVEKAYGMFIDTWIPIHTKIMYSLILQQTPRSLITTGPSIKFTEIELTN